MGCLCEKESTNYEPIMAQPKICSICKKHARNQMVYICQNCRMDIGHINCVNQWLSIYNICPLCRACIK